MLLIPPPKYSSGVPTFHHLSMERWIMERWITIVWITIGFPLNPEVVVSWLSPLSFLSHATYFLLSSRMTVLRHKVDHITLLLRSLQRLCVGLILPKRPSMVWTCHLSTYSSLLFSRGWIISSQMIYLIQPPVAVTMILFGNKVFVDLIKWRLSKWNNPELPRYTLNSMIGGLMRQMRVRL